MDDILVYGSTRAEHDRNLRDVLSRLRQAATYEKFKEIQANQKNDATCQFLTQFSTEGWPAKKALDQECRAYWQHRSDIVVEDGLLMRGSRIIIPKAMRNQVLDSIHQGHQGIVKCRARARESVWWPGLSKQIELVKGCTQCIQETINCREPLIPTPFPERPWQQGGIDLFYLKHKWYLLVTDYYSRYPEVAPLASLSAVSVVDHMKSIFARHGTPETVYSDNGPQFQRLLGSEFSKFSKEWTFAHKTSSPMFPQSNGFVEAGVKIIKRSWKKTDDAYRALQAYRATPLANGFSPAELLMGRRIRTSVPIVPSLLKQATPEPQKLRKWEEENKEKQKRNFDTRHAARPLKPLQSGQRAWIIDQRTSGTVQYQAGSPHSYHVKTDRGTARRNRFHLVPSTPTSSGVTATSDSVQPLPELPAAPSSGPQGLTVTRNGRTVKPVNRLNL